MSQPLPAWSLPADAVDRIALPRDWPEHVTRDWAWGGATGAGVRVCILDSGIEPGHPDVGAVQESVAIRMDGDETIVEPDAEGDVAGHGTACAGIVRRKYALSVSSCRSAANFCFVVDRLMLMTSKPCSTAQRKPSSSTGPLPA